MISVRLKTMKAFINRCLLVISLVYLFYGCAASPKPTEPVIMPEKPIITETISLAEEMKENYSRKNFDGIIKIYEKREKEFTGTDTLKPVILSYLWRKSFDQIVKIAEEKLANMPNVDDREVNLIVGISYYEKGLFEASRRILSNLYESGYRHELLNIYLSLIFMKKNQTSLALSVSAEIEDQSKKNYIQGKIFFNEGSYEKALERFSNTSGYKDIEDHIIQCLYYLGKYNEILKIYEEKKVQLNRRTAAVIASVLISNGDIKRAEELLKGLPDQEKTGSFYRNIGLIYDIYFEDKEKARELYNKYLTEVNDEEVTSWIAN